MSNISRRSLLGYSGTAAAGAVFASAGTAAAEDTDADAAQPTAVEFSPGSKFEASSSMAESDLMMEMTFSVRVDWPNGYPSAHDITPLEIANALSAIAESKGWPPLTFYGPQPPAPLN
ncbi:hypothetical protein PUR49_10265 [Streptomyces sp. BE147]|uniref:hypothetical protein n=1 Tax=Streptomyces sp. BE147 TaxID=3002524 RepID=UPI002E76F724|nr:hypothetical protein [Streptomyces sp. BE147]MEE1736882.1 hypothetical protein [Streptomyces sp. BE147]